MGPNVVSFVHLSEWFLFLCGLLLSLEKMWGLKSFQQLLFFMEPEFEWDKTLAVI